MYEQVTIKLWSKDHFNSGLIKFKLNSEQSYSQLIYFGKEMVKVNATIVLRDSTYSVWQLYKG